MATEAVQQIIDLGTPFLRLGSELASKQAHFFVAAELNRVFCRGLQTGGIYELGLPLGGFGREFFLQLFSKEKGAEFLRRSSIFWASYQEKLRVNPGLFVHYGVGLEQFYFCYPEPARKNAKINLQLIESVLTSSSFPVVVLDLPEFTPDLPYLAKVARAYKKTIFILYSRKIDQSTLSSSLYRCNISKSVSSPRRAAWTVERLRPFPETFFVKGC